MLSGAIVVAYTFNSGGYDPLYQQQLALAVWWVLGVGVVVGLLPVSVPSRPAWIPVVGLLALAGWTALSLSWTESPDRTYADLTRVVGYLGLVLLGLSLLGRGTWRPAAGGITTAALLICCGAIGSRIAPSVFPDDVTVEAFQPDRLAYPLGYWNALAAWAAISATAAIGWSAHARSSVVRSLALGIAPVAGCTLYLTYSRGGLLAFAIGLLALIVLSRNRWTASLHALTAILATAAAVGVIRANPEVATGDGGSGGGLVLLGLAAAALACAWVAQRTYRLRPPELKIPDALRRAAVPAMIVALLATAIALGPQAASQIRQSVQAPISAQEADPATRLGSLGGRRHELWSSAISAFDEDPARGIGSGTFEFWWARTTANPALVRDGHSLYLETLAELGLVGLLILLAFLAGALRAAWLARPRLDKTSSVGAAAAMISGFVVFLVSAGVDWMWEVPAVAVLALASLTVALASASHRRRSRGGIARLPVQLAIGAAAIAVGALQIPGIVATDRIRASEGALESGDWPRALALANDAVDVQGWAAAPYAQRALALGVLDEPLLVRSELDEAIEREPTNWRHPLLLAVIEFVGGDRIAARRSYRRARELRAGLPADGRSVLRALSLVDFPKEE